MKGKKYRLREKLKGARAKENKRLREKIKVQIVLTVDIKCMRVKITCEEWKIWGRIKGA